MSLGKKRGFLNIGDSSNSQEDPLPKQHSISGRSQIAPDMPISSIFFDPSKLDKSKITVTGRIMEKSRKTSGIWEYVYKGVVEINGKDVERFICSLCPEKSTEFGHWDTNPSHGTANIKRHLVTYHRNQIDSSLLGDSDKKQMHFRNDGKLDTPSIPAETQALYLKQLSIAVVDSKTPYNFLSNPEWRLFFHMMCPGFRIPCADTLASSIQDIGINAEGGT